MSKGLVYAVFALLVVGGAATYVVATRDEGVSGGTTPSSPVVAGGLAASDVTASTSGGGLARVKLEIQVHMPEGFDELQPERAFRGRGVVDQGRGIAGVYYEVAGVPNSAGYFGHVDPTMSVVYEGARFIVSFPELAELLEGPTDWMSYEISDLSDPKMLELGIGQLREIGLSDPRLATELLAAVGNLETRMLSPGEPRLGRAFQATVVVASLADTGSEMQPVFEELLALGVSSIDVEVVVDPDNRISRFAYSLSYPPKEGSDPVDLNVDMQFLQYGVQRGLRAPSDGAVVTVDEFFGK